MTRAGSGKRARQLVLDGKYQAGLAALQSLGFDDHPDIAAFIGLARTKPL